MNFWKMAMCSALVFTCGLFSHASESIVGTWTYRQGSFTDVHVYHADGTVTAPSSAVAHAKWRIEGDEIVTLWHNQWYNRLKLPIANSAISGVSISPTGARASVTLTRVGGVPTDAPTKVPTNVSSDAGSMAGTWTYHHTSGMFTDIHVYHADGTVTAPNNAGAHATWRVEGNEIVTLWHNKWYNRLKLPISGSTIYGVSISPNGGSAEITLTRVGKDGGKDVPVQNPDGPFSNSINIAGKWYARFINRPLNFRQKGSHVTAEYGIKGDFTAHNVLTGTWQDAASGVVNKFQFVFSKDANYITGGFWDRNTGNLAYSHSNIINGAYRDGVTPPR